jgi:YidC/Oxa1 family membrane protein insertase
MSDQRNLVLAIVLTFVIIMGFQLFYEGPRIREAQQRAEAERATAQTVPAPADPTVLTAPSAPTVPLPSPPAAVAEAPAPKVTIDSARLHGELSLKGARIDRLTLADYHVTVNPSSPEITLLSPPGTPNPYFAEFGWVASDQAVPVPASDTLWHAEQQKLTPQQPVTLRWDNGQGLSFAQNFSLDANYMFAVHRTVTNNGAAPVTLYSYGRLSRWGKPPIAGFYILHEGPIGVLGGTLHEPDYDDLLEERIALESTGGWLGFTDKYWLGALIPQQDMPVKATFNRQADGDRYQTDFLGAPLTIQPGQTIEVTDRLFAGAKEVKLLDAYAEQHGIPLFDRAVDFGWFYFLTKPIFNVLHWLHGAVGNYGIAILILTLLVKLVFFPLANKSYKAMSQMKKLQPEMMKLRERFEDDKAKMNQELMALYKREKVNPVSGCLPIIIQIPVFFALYKVLFVTIEMRHAPFYGWIDDLSAPDPTTLFNLFGLLPFTPPQFLMIGVWPLLMGFTMFLQQKLNPQPADPTQARIMMFLPVMFTFLFATFPAGLVIYWTWNNLLSIAQQWLIMRRMGVPAS